MSIPISDPLAVPTTGAAANSLPRRTALLPRRGRASHLLLRIPGYDRGVVRRPHYLARASVAFARRPREGCERIVDRIGERRERRLAPFAYDVDPDWEARLHSLLGIAWPCEARAEFDSLWLDVVDLFREKGLAFGRGAFGGWDDADPAFARAAWCVTRHLRPAKVVETGVARGVTTRVILEALERNGDGRLWSIDLPPLIERNLRIQTAAAVPESRRARWRYVEGSSRRRLPQLLRTLGEIDVFVHDSMHTERNLRFELASAARVLRAPGALLADDVQRNPGFRSYVGPGSVVCPSDDGSGLFGVIVRPSSPATKPKVADRPGAPFARNRADL
jgi:hypothetical protein